jgi:septum formation protein
LFSQEIALLKARDILQKKGHHEDCIIVGADTIVVIDQKILGKPSSIEDARSMLQRLSGREHSVYTSVVLLHGKRERVFTIETQVTFNPIPESLLQSYLDSKDSLDKAGSYGIQGESLSFISAVKGSYSNVVGFPLSHFITELTEFLGLNLESDWRTSFK